MIYDSNNIFAKIISGKLDSDKIYEDESVLAFKDKYPVAPIHILVIPKGQFVDFSDFVRKADSETISKFFKTIDEIVVKLGLDKTGFRIVNNQGKDALQAVPHFHIHILGGKSLGPILESDVYHK